MASDRANLILRPSFPCAGADLRAARTCEQTVFGRSFGNTPAELHDAYGRYEDGTSFGGVFLPDGSAVGAVRLMRQGRHGLKSLHDAASRPWQLATKATCQAVDIQLARTWDVGSFGVDSIAVGATRETTMALFSVMFGAFRDNGVATFVAILDAGARRPIEAVGVRMLDLPGARPAAYLGSAASTPVYRHVHDLHQQHEVQFPDVHQQVFHGRHVAGLDSRRCQPGAFELSAA
ncbi:MAG: hypothetical protein QOE01_1398 [Actinomycetota bacterium]|jgi:hypothetical protein|nr:hypothetical protein [Actinomycetota bacterium]